MFDWRGIRVPKVPMHVRWTLFGIICGIAIGVGLLATPHYEPCPNNDPRSHHCNTGAANQENHSIPFIVTDWTARNHELVEALGVVATALFTLALFVSTYMLWSVTSETLSHAREDSARQSREMKESLDHASRQSEAAIRAANAADLSAKAAIGVELPILRIVKVVTGRDESWEKNKPFWIERVRPTITVKNFGRTPAFIDEVIFQRHLGLPIPTPPIFDRESIYISANMEIDGKEEKSFTDYTLEDAISAEQQSVFLTDPNYGIALYGIIKFTDFLGTRHTQTWLALWVDQTPIWTVARGIEGYADQT
ncbi:MAG TPA: hypothetical protein VHZ78_00700 [Rhizomicrobium sp.]|jgi:hypothetical protein|nr:hypothetical protein [Rhizomicrobium sp.]